MKNVLFPGVMLIILVKVLADDALVARVDDLCDERDKFFYT